MNEEEIRKEEENHLAETVSKVLEGMKHLEKELEHIGSGNLERLKEFRETGMDAYDPDFFMLLEQLHQQNETFNIKYKYQRLKEFEQMMAQPYFARIDVSGDDIQNKNNLYIGKSGYTEDKPIIIDWRAKIASIYYRYRYPQKNVEYDTPEGKKVLDLLLKRTFEIDDGHLIKYFNNDIQLDEHEIIIEKIEGRTGGVLEDIIETIQLSQLDIIESDPRQICIVQGCVGSGKSTVAIHKLAHIFFNYPDLIHPDKSILIAKNQILVGYLSTLFPKLGIFNINFKTIRELLVNIIFREKLKINIDLDANTDTSIISLSRMRHIKKKISEIHVQTEEELIKIFGSNEDFELYAGYKYTDTISPHENIADIIQDLNEELWTQKESLKLNPNSVNVWFYKENISILRKLIAKLTKLDKNINSNILNSLAKSEGINTLEKLGYWETLLYVYMYSEIIGITKYRMFEYCVVDEGQDFSPLEYAFLSKIVLRGRFAIFGDLNQSLEKDGINSWDDIPEVIKEAGHATKFSLDTNYRSTRPIIEYANNLLLPYTDTYLPKSINRQGKEPQEILGTTEFILGEFQSLIQEDIKEINKSIGIICLDNELLQKAEEILKSFKIPADKLIYLDPGMTVHYIPQGVYYMDIEDCKGLEFAKVYVLGLNPEKINSFEIARKAFVAVTRAMNELVILGTTKHENI